VLGQGAVAIDPLLDIIAMFGRVVDRDTNLPGMKTGFFGKQGDPAFVGSLELLQPVPSPSAEALAEEVAGGVGGGAQRRLDWLGDTEVDEEITGLVPHPYARRHVGVEITG
jgi:hypothetical protein